MTPEEADAKQELKGMDGAIAWQLIERHAESWTEIGEMMHAWLRANQPVIEAQEETKMVEMTAEDANNYSRILTILGMEEEGNPVAMIEKMHATIVTIAKFI